MLAFLAIPIMFLMGAADPARADQRHRRRQQPRLARAADFFQDDVARVAGELIVAERHGCGQTKVARNQRSSWRARQQILARDAERERGAALSIGSESVRERGFAYSENTVVGVILKKTT